MSLEKFRNIHKGETMLLVCNGENLKYTPPEMFDYPSFGFNTIHMYEGWMPNYYAAVDRRVVKEFGGAISNKYTDIPKFIRKDLEYWQGENFYPFKVRRGVLWSLNDSKTIWQDDIDEMTYGNIVHVGIKLALHMGAKNILIIGMEHKQLNGTAHFWGRDEGGVDHTPLEDWFEGYRQLVAGAQAHGVEILNISPETYVPNDIIPRGNHEVWTKPAAQFVKA